MSGVRRAAARRMRDVHDMPSRAFCYVYYVVFLPVDVAMRC